MEVSEPDLELKRSDTRELEKAPGSAFDAVWNLPTGARRIGQPGETQGRKLRDPCYTDEIDTGRGDDAIIKGYYENR